MNKKRTGIKKDAPRVSFYTVGCKLNQYDTELMAQKLVDLGFTRVDWADNADLYIINSCSVTTKAAADSRRKIFSARRKSPDARIIITGCYAQIKSRLLKEFEEVDLVIGNDRKDQIIDQIARIYPDINADQYGNGNPALRSLYRHSRALIKIQDGCNQNCSYCVVPLGRGRERSRPVSEIIEEVRLVSDNNYKEIILTGVHIGRYADNGTNLSGLLERILEKTDIDRIRLSSVEPNEIDRGLIDLASAGDRICPHFHIPLQSGSDKILRSMNRPYKVSRYLETIEMLKSSVPNVMIGADVIVGFPGESENDFRESMNLVENSPVDYLHVFSYSDHPEARSFGFPDKLEVRIIKTRNSLLTALGDLKWQKFLGTQISRVLPVLFENRFDKKSGNLTGLSDNYVRVECPGSKDYYNEIIMVRPKEISGTRIVGEIIA